MTHPSFAVRILARHSERLSRLKAFLLDVDGVLTDGGITYSAAGIESKTFHVRDGHGIRAAQDAGIRIGIITGRASEVVALRARELRITDLYQGVLNKIEPYEEFKSLYGLKDEEIGYMGDDVLDLPVIKNVGFSACPKNAHSSVRIAVHCVSHHVGGQGAVREMLDLVLAAQGILPIEDLP